MRAVSSVLVETLLCLLVRVLLTNQQQSVSNLVEIPLAVQEIISPDIFSHHGGKPTSQDPGQDSMPFL